VDPELVQAQPIQRHGRRLPAVLLALAALLLSAWSYQNAGDPAITLRWETASEVDTAGYNIYRADEQNGPLAKINARLIPASADPIVGGSFAFTDTAVQAGRTYYYQLEEVETGGAVNREAQVIEVPAGGAGLLSRPLALVVGFVALLVVLGLTLPGALRKLGSR
jgi:hypothetical protein